MNATKERMMVEMPEHVKQEMKLWRMGLGPCSQYIDWNENLAATDLNRLKSTKGLTVHRSWMASDGWMDGCRFLHAIVELPPQHRKSGDNGLLKIKFSDSQAWYIMGCGSWMASSDYPEVFDNPKRPEPKPEPEKKVEHGIEVPEKVTFRSARNAINDFLKKNHMSSDTAFYTPKAWKERGEEYGGGKDSILVMTFEGPFYEVMNYLNPLEVHEAFFKLIEDMGLWFELGNAWNLTLYRS